MFVTYMNFLVRSVGLWTMHLNNRLLDWICLKGDLNIDFVSDQRPICALTDISERRLVCKRVVIQHFENEELNVRQQASLSVELVSSK